MHALTRSFPGRRAALFAALLAAGLVLSACDRSGPGPAAPSGASGTTSTAPGPSTPGNAGTDTPRSRSDGTGGTAGANTGSPPGADAGTGTSK